MQGQILVINEEKQAGAISLGDGVRALFRLSDWVDVLPPQAGMQVTFEFDAETRRARRVQLAYEQPRMPPPAAPNFALAPKRKNVLTLLAFFLGGVGGHRFYLGAWGWGLVQLLGIPLMGTLFLVLLPPVGILLYLAYLVFVLVEVIRYILMSDAEFDLKLQRYQARVPGPFGFFW